MRPAARFFLALMGLAAAAGGGALWGSVQRFNLPGPLGDDKAVVIPRGSGVAAIARKLDDEGVINQPYLFMAGAKFQNADREMKAGEYLFPAHVSIADAIELIRSGKAVVRRLTVPEGLTSAQVVALLAAESALSGTIDKPPANGTLLPETYHYTWGDDRGQIVERMQVAMKAALDDLWPHRDRSLPYDSRDKAVTLASIVEKETAVPGERAKVAGVFVNRLGTGMKLQSDPTVVYALTKGDGNLGRPLTRADWKVESPYNTYVTEGLPPSPIANPGRASLEAALHPERHDYLYFVADGTGGHAFARTLPDHNRNVAQWRQLQRDVMGGQSVGPE